MLSSPDAIGARLLALKPETIVPSHSAAVAHYSATLSDERSEQFFREVRRDGFAIRASTGNDNPAAPCSLLRAFRLSGVLTKLWDQLARGAVPRDDSQRTFEITARLFAGEMRRQDQASERLIAQATQQDCLDEIFEPGTIERRTQINGEALR